MVLIHYKKSKNDQFIIESSAQSPVSELRKNLIFMNNLRIKLDKLIQSIEGLMSHGPLKPESLRGLTMPETIQPALELLPKEQIPFASTEVSNISQELRPDKTGYRTGVAPIRSISDQCMERVHKYIDLLNPQRADKRTPISEQEINEAVDMIRAAIMIVYPGYHSLPPWETTVLILEDKMNFIQQWPNCGWLEASQSAIWWAKKELTMEKKLCDYIGRNEKTKIIVKIEAVGKGGPLAEPPIDAETQKKMMAYYYKKQEEMKKLEENNENDYMNSAWANPNFLKNQMNNGGRNIRWK